MRVARVPLYSQYESVNKVEVFVSELVLSSRMSTLCYMLIAGGIIEIPQQTEPLPSRSADPKLPEAKDNAREAYAAHQKFQGEGFSQIEAQGWGCPLLES